MFAHLHLHTEYSLLDGACRIKSLVERLKELGMKSCAITDHGVMYGVIDFYKACKEAGIHPVIGCEVYVCPNMDEKTSIRREYSHLILLCENQKGYWNLTQLVSQGFVRGFYYRPRVDYALLEKYSEGLICMSACLSGDIPKLLLDGRENDAREMALRYQAIFGKGNFFIEIQDHMLPEEKQVLPGLVRLARELDIPLAATNDCHYLTREDAAAQEVLMCIQTGKTLNDTQRMRMETDQLYVKSEAEMREMFPNFPEALSVTEEIAQRCHVEFEFGKTKLPKFPLPEGETDSTAYFLRLCREGLEKKYGLEREDARKRLEYEQSVIMRMGYVDYFLIVWDFINYAKSHGVCVGPGRGSGAGSIAAYCMGITEIDPLKYNLLFERFLNPERVSMPDFDVDFDYERRGKVIKYVEERYGADHVAQIITFGTMAAKAVIRDVGRVLDMPYQRVDAVSKMVPFELNMTLNRALEISPELRKAYESDADTKKLIDMAKKLEGMPRHASTHAAGVLITAKPVSDYVPLQTNDDVITTQFPMGTLEALGLLKMDFLGLRTLNVIHDTIEMAGLHLRPEEIPMDDAGVYAMISEGETDGVFQLESGGMRQFLTNMKPENFEDIVAAISLYRPGPMESIPRYIQGKQHPESVRYSTEKLRPILDVTYGCMVYQEQVMQIVRDLAGYSMGRSDLVRRAMAKKKHDVMAQEKEHFIHGLQQDGEWIVPGAVRLGVPEEVAERIFDEMTAFASYAFNKSHAAAYAVVAVQTGYLKLHYPVEFIAALINSMEGNAVKIAYYIQYCRRKGIAVLPPDVNVSEGKFSVEMSDGKKALRFGLSGIKGLGHNAVEEIVLQRKQGGKYADLFDFIKRARNGALNKKSVESLIRAGAMDTLRGYRSQKLAAYERAMDGVSRQEKGMVEGQLSLFSMDEGLDAPPPPLPDIEECSSDEKLRMEHDVLGIYITGHPLDRYADILSKMEVNSQVLSTLQEDTPDKGMSWDGRTVSLGGIIAEKKMKAVKSGNMMAFVQLEDMYGRTEVLVFPKVYERVGEQLQAETAALLTGRLSVREEEMPKLLLESVSALDAPIQTEPIRRDSGQQGRLYLRLTQAQREEALAILRRTPGRIPVYLYMAEEKKTYLAPNEYWVNGGYDFFALAELLGEDSVIYK